MNKSITYPGLFLIIVSAVVLGGLIQWRIVGRTEHAAASSPRTLSGDQPRSRAAM